MIKSGLFGADFHLGAWQYNRAERGSDYERAFEALFDAAIEDPRINFITLLGDVGDIAHEKKPEIAFIRKQVKKARAAGKIVYHIKGNHDCGSPSLPAAIEVEGFVDAEDEFYRCLERGEAFRPYGPDGPAVCALHNVSSPSKLWEKLNAIRGREIGGNESTELWLHQAIVPGVPAFKAEMAEFDMADFANAGWHTILAGDIHNGGLWEVAAQNGKGILIYPGSPEMTDINETETLQRGFILHSPIDPEPIANSGSFTRIPYNNRPYKSFTFQGSQTPQETALVLKWVTDVTLKTGLMPVVRIVTPDTNWRTCKELLPVVLKLLVKAPPYQAPEMVPGGNALLLDDGTVGGGNATRYGLADGPGTLLQKLVRVLENSDAPDGVKKLGTVVLENPQNPEVWSKQAETLLPAQNAA